MKNAGCNTMLIYKIGSPVINHVSFSSLLVSVTHGLKEGCCSFCYFCCRRGQ